MQKEDADKIKTLIGEIVCIAERNEWPVLLISACQVDNPDGTTDTYSPFGASGLGEKQLEICTKVAFGPFLVSAIDQWLRIWVAIKELNNEKLKFEINEITKQD